MVCEKHCTTRSKNINQMALFFREQPASKNRSFGQAFSKACGFQRQSLWSHSAECEIPFDFQHGKKGAWGKFPRILKKCWGTFPHFLSFVLLSYGEYGCNKTASTSWASRRARCLGVPSIAGRLSRKNDPPDRFVRRNPSLLAGYALHSSCTVFFFRQITEQTDVFFRLPIAFPAIICYKSAVPTAVFVLMQFSCCFFHLHPLQFPR